MKTSATWPRAADARSRRTGFNAPGAIDWVHNADCAGITTCECAVLKATGAARASGGMYSGSWMKTSRPQPSTLATYPGRQSGTLAAAHGGGSEMEGDAWPNNAASTNEARVGIGPPLRACRDAGYRERLSSGG